MRNKLQQLLRENINNGITRLVVMDFDGTLVDTLDRERGAIAYKEKTGEEWPFAGWWGRKESLDMSVFDFQPIPSVKSLYEKERAKPNTMVIMLTGRRPKLGGQVKAILDANGMTFDAYLYNYGSDTLSNKIEQIGNILGELESIDTILQIDDRDDHMPTFKQYGEGLVEKGRLKEFELLQIKPNGSIVNL